MRLVYKPLFRVHLRHSFYTDGRSVDDLSVEPAPATRRLLDRHGLVPRPLADGVAVYGEVRPGSDPLELLRPLGDGVLRLAFLLNGENPALWNITDLPQYRPGGSVFCFDNLRHDPDEGRLCLGDSVAARRVGPPATLVTGDAHSYRFASPVNAATVTIRDFLGATVATRSFALDDPAEKTREYRLDLGAVDELTPGRYTLTDDHGGSENIYYDGEIFARRPFGVVEIFNRTATDTSDRVPAAHRFLDGNRLTGPSDYHVQLERRATTWRYNVAKKYGSNGVSLASLTVTGEVAFAKVPDSDPPIFVSTGPVALREKRADLVLQSNGERLRNLPSPGAGTPLEKGAAAGSYVSELYVYV